jgi:hypothetical protein
MGLGIVVLLIGIPLGLLMLFNVHFWAPEVASKIPAGNPPPPAPCELGPNVQGAGTDHVTVDVDLIWSPTQRPGCQ